jgi:hypothetical protein
MRKFNKYTECDIIYVGRRRDGGSRFWCMAHKADATAKYGVAAAHCVAAFDEPIPASATLELDPSVYPGGVALWGSVPACYDTTTLPTDRGIHVHARKNPGLHKDIDATYRRLLVPFRKDLISGPMLEVEEIDAINFMISSVFGFPTIEIHCTHCGFSHLDRDWFAVHLHRRHQCHGCGRQFSDVEAGIGNPVAGLRTALHTKTHPLKPAGRTIEIEQVDYRGGIQVWGSNPAIYWTSDASEEIGIHLHAFKKATSHVPHIDDTFDRVVVDGVELDANQVRYYMAQSAMPHLDGRVMALICSACGAPHFDTAERAYTPHINHECETCGATFRARASIKKSIGNPFAAVRLQLSSKAPNPLRNDHLGFRPETI